MSVKFYDVALTNKIKNLFSNTIYQTRELTYKTLTDKNGEVKFPLISIFRPDGWSISADNTWVSKREFLLDIRSVIVDLSYQIDIYANTREDLEDITSELVLYLLRNPGISVVYTSVDLSEDITIKTQVEIVSGPDRTSELDDTTSGRPYRYTLTCKLANARILDFSSEDPESGSYVSKVTQILVSVETIDVNVTTNDTNQITEYIDREESYGKN